MEESGSGTELDNLPINKNMQPEHLKKIVERLMSHESQRLSFEAKKIAEKQKNPSSVWLRYKQAIIDKKPICIWKCDDCTTLFVYKSATGHSHMMRHNCKNIKKITVETSAQQKMDKFVVKTVPQCSIRELNKCITIGLAKDLQPISRAEREGFRYIAQALVNFGAKFGRHQIENVIHHRTTLRRNHLPDICKDLKDDIKQTLNDASSFPKFAFSKDMWTEKSKSQEFLSLTVHFIDKNWQLRKNMLGLETFDNKKTTANIRKECESILSQYFDETQLDSVISNSTSTTDGGSNMLNVFPQRLPCWCHKINCGMDWTFNDRKIPSAENIAKKEKRGKPYAPKHLFGLKQHCPEIYVSLNGIKELVTYFKNAKINCLLPTTLKQEVSTRWNSELIMFESYIASSNEVKAILIEKQQVKRCMSIDDTLVREVIEFLKPFRECSEILSGDTYPTIQLVALWANLILEHVKPNAKDSPEMKNLRAQAEHCFREYLEYEHIYLVACILHPRYKSLHFVEHRKRKGAIELLKRFIEEEEESNVSTVVSVPSTQKKPSRFEKFKDRQITNESELERYLNFNFAVEEDDEKFDILQFWSGALEYPVLQKIAHWVLAIPASEASNERVFSDAGFAVTPKSTTLGADTLSYVVFVHQNADLKNKKFLLE